MSQAEHTELVAASTFFDRDWYLQNYPDVAIRHQDPLQHFLTLGWRLGRSPSAAFNTRIYLELNQDVAAAGVNPLLHYLLYGQAEGRLLQYPVTSHNQIKAADFIAFVEKQLEQQPAQAWGPRSLEQQLQQTQQQLEHYFLRCQTLEHDMRQLKCGLTTVDPTPESSCDAKTISVVSVV